MRPSALCASALLFVLMVSLFFVGMISKPCFDVDARKNFKKLLTKSNSEAYHAKVMRKTKKNKRYDPLLPPSTGAFAVMGRPLVYDKQYHCKLVYRLALLNLSESEMCVALDVAIDTLVLWKKTYPEFHAALRAGREQADAKVARALYRRALGWGILEEEVISRKLRDKDGNEHIETKVVPRRKRYPPDVQAISMWLRNRQPAKWRISGDQVATQSAVQVNIDLSSLTLEELRMAQRLGLTRTDNNTSGGNGHNLLNA